MKNKFFNALLFVSGGGILDKMLVTEKEIVFAQYAWSSTFLAFFFIFIDYLFGANLFLVFQKSDIFMHLNTFISNVCFSLSEDKWLAPKNCNPLNDLFRYFSFCIMLTILITTMFLCLHIFLFRNTFWIEIISQKSLMFRQALSLALSMIFSLIFIIPGMFIVSVTAVGAFFSVDWQAYITALLMPWFMPVLVACLLSFLIPAKI